MKLLVIGHTRGLGLKIYDHLQERYSDVAGCSRGDQCDIESAEGRKNILKEAKKYDVVILNAHSGFGQTKMLYELFDAYREENKKIICLGSLSPDIGKNFPHSYASEKASLDFACNQLQNCHSKISITLIRPGWIATSRTLELTEDQKLDPKNVLAILDFVLDNSNTMNFRNITFEAVPTFNKEKMKTNPWM